MSEAASCRHEDMQWFQPVTPVKQQLVDMKICSGSNLLLLLVNKKSSNQMSIDKGRPRSMPVIKEGDTAQDAHWRESV